MYILRFKCKNFTPDNNSKWYETCVDNTETLSHLIDSLEDNDEIKCWRIEGHTSKSLGLEPFGTTYVKEKASKRVKK